MNLILFLIYIKINQFIVSSMSFEFGKRFLVLLNVYLSNKISYLLNKS